MAEDVSTRAGGYEDAAKADGGLTTVADGKVVNDATIVDGSW